MYAEYVPTRVRVATEAQFAAAFEAWLAAEAEHPLPEDILREHGKRSAAYLCMLLGAKTAVVPEQPRIAADPIIPPVVEVKP